MSVGCSTLGSKQPDIIIKPVLRQKQRKSQLLSQNESKQRRYLLLTPIYTEIRCLFQGTILVDKRVLLDSGQASSPVIDSLAQQPKSLLWKATEIFCFGQSNRYRCNRKGCLDCGLVETFPVDNGARAHSLSGTTALPSSILYGGSSSARYDWTVLVGRRLREITERSHEEQAEASEVAHVKVSTRLYES